MKKMIQLAGTCLVLLMNVVPGLAEQRLTILHTNDLHSHLLGADGRNSGLKVLFGILLGDTHRNRLPGGPETPGLR